MKHVLSVCSSGEHCVLATRNEDNVNPYGLILCNSIGNILEYSSVLICKKDHLFEVENAQLFVNVAYE